MLILHDAIADGNHDQITWLIARSSHVDDPDFQGDTPLMLAMRSNCLLSNIRRLLKRRARLNAVNHAGCTPLMVALDHSETEGIAALLRQYRRNLRDPSEDVDETWESGRLALLLAIYRDDLSGVARLVKAAKLPNAVGHTPLMVACLVGNEEAARLLLKHGAPTGTTCLGDPFFRGATALHIAADEGYAGCARALLEAGADVNARDAYGATPLILVAFRSSGDTCRVLLEHGADVHAESLNGKTALTQAAWLADEEVIRMLLEHGAANPERLQQALHACFVDNNSDKAPLLVEAGAHVGLAEAVLLKDWPEVHRRLNAGAGIAELNAALCAAAAYAGAGVVRLLLSRGADPNARCTDGLPCASPLHRSFWNLWEDEEVFDVLLDAGADPCATDDEGNSPVNPGRAWSNSEDVHLHKARRLADLGADLDAPNRDGWTALMSASWLRERSVVSFLLERGVAVDHQDSEGRTALRCAADTGDARIARMLSDHRADWDLPDHKGRTPRHVAERWLDRPIAKLPQRHA